MKYLKKFENKKQFREVDLQQLYDDFKYFENKLILTYSNQYTPLGNFRLLFMKHVLIPLLLDKEIEFHKTISPLDDEVRWGFFGRVKNIGIKFQEDQILITVDLYDNKKNLILAYLTKIEKNLKKKKSTMVKIYNSEETDFEKTISELKFIEKLEKEQSKYNL